jgi:hypothetical protein
VYKTIFFGLMGIGLVMSVGFVVGDDDSDDDSDHRDWSHEWQEARLDVAPVDDPLYMDECGACHFVYQPGLLPARSWEHMMRNLDDHFGDNAELSQDVATRISDYLVSNAADRSRHKRSRSITRALTEAQMPSRITGMAYFQRKHDEMPIRLVAGNPEVGSFANCQACHAAADTGSYDDDEIRIAGYGKWDD